MNSSQKSQKQQANFFISVEVFNNLRTFIPKGEQSNFVEKAISGALSNLKFQDSLKNSFGAWKSRSGDTEKFVRKLRQSNRPLR